MAKRIYVGNLPYSVDGQQLAELFGEYGQVEEAIVVTDRDSGQSKGFGFVQMSVDAEALNAIAQLNGTQLGNRTLRVNEAQPRTDRQGYGGGGGGGRRGGGGYGGGGYGGVYGGGGYDARGGYDTGYQSRSRW